MNIRHEYDIKGEEKGGREISENWEKRKKRRKKKKKKKKKPFKINQRYIGWLSTFAIALFLRIQGGGDTFILLILS